MDDESYIDLYTATDEETGEETEGMIVKGKDVVMLDAPEVLLSPETPLLTEAQDVAGAINELKKSLAEGGGESDKWVRPADWPAMPEPADNQVIALITTQWNMFPTEYVTLYAYKSGDTAVNFDGITSFGVDWGDGYSETVELPSSAKYISHYHYFYDSDDNSWNDGPVLDNGAHVFVITVTIPDNAYFVMGRDCETLEMYVGRNVKFYNMIPGSKNMLEHVKFFGWQPTEENAGMLSGCSVLQCVDATEPLMYIPQNAFQYCYSLNENGIDLSECTQIDSNGFYNTAVTKIVSNALSAINNYAFYNCYALKSLDTPNLSTVGSSAFYGCYNIESITHAEDWTYQSSAFSNLYKWYDNPTMKHPQLT